MSPCSAGARHGRTASRQAPGGLLRICDVEVGPIERGIGRRYRPSSTTGSPGEGGRVAVLPARQERQSDGRSAWRGHRFGREISETGTSRLPRDPSTAASTSMAMARPAN